MSKSNQQRPRVPCAARQGCYSNLTAVGNHNFSYFHISTFNARTLHKDADVDQLIGELDNVNAGIVAIQETRSKESKCKTWHSGHRVLIGAREERSRSGGVGFIVPPEYLPYVSDMRAVSPRVAVLHGEVKRVTFTVVNVYAPTSEYDDEVVEEPYDDIERELTNSRAHVKLVVGDFNASIGPRDDGETYVGHYAADTRNDRGQRLADFAESQCMYVLNTMFQQRKRRLWTWQSPNGAKKQLDYVLCNDAHRVVDCKIVGRSWCGSSSDHRLVKSIINFGSVKFRRRTSRRGDVDPGLARAIMNQVDWSRYGSPQSYSELSRELARASAEARPVIRAHPRERLTSKTIELIRERRKRLHQGQNVQSLSRDLRKMVEADYKSFNEVKALEAAERLMSIKKVRQRYSLHKEATVAMMDKDGALKTKIQDIADIIKDFYGDLFASKKRVPKSGIEMNEDVPEFMESEVEHALKRMPNNRAPGNDGISIDLLKYAPKSALSAICRLFNSILSMKIVPENWKGSNTILIHKKGSKEDINNYRPIALMSQLSKLFSRVILNRISKWLEEGNRREQAGFRGGYSTIDHIHTVCQVIERSREYKIPLCMLFVDFKKAFDSVEKQAVLNALKHHAVPESYVSMIDELYTQCATDIQLLHTPVKVPVERGVKQGDVISPTLFSASLECALRDANMSGGYDIDGETLQFLLFADDVVLIAKDPCTLQKNLGELIRVTSLIGLEAHPGKTQWMANDHCPNGGADIRIGNSTLEKVGKYVYLGREVNPSNSLTAELSRRKQSGWKAFWKLRDVLTNVKLSKEVKAKVFNTHVLPAMTYASETWCTTKKDEESLLVTQRAMERKMVGTRLRDRMSNVTLREKSGVDDIIDRIYSSKHRWAGHVIRRNDNRWTTRVTEWRPRDYKRPQGRPPTRWADPMVKSFGRPWNRIARCRSSWRSCDLRCWRANS